MHYIFLCAKSKYWYFVKILYFDVSFTSCIFNLNLANICRQTRCGERSTPRHKLLLRNLISLAHLPNFKESQASVSVHRKIWSSFSRSQTMIRVVFLRMWTVLGIRKAAPACPQRFRPSRTTPDGQRFTDVSWSVRPRNREGTSKLAFRKFFWFFLYWFERA